MIKISKTITSVGIVRTRRHRSMIKLVANASNGSDPIQNAIQGFSSSRGTTDNSINTTNLLTPRSMDTDPTHNPVAMRRKKDLYPIAELKNCQSHSVGPNINSNQELGACANTIATTQSTTPKTKWLKKSLSLRSTTDGRSSQIHPGLPSRLLTLLYQ